MFAGLLNERRVARRRAVRDLGPEPVSVGSPHDVGVEAESDSRINVSHLCLDIGKVVAGGDMYVM